MRNNLLEKHLVVLEDPVRRALVAYETLSGKQLGFETHKAGRLEPTPDKPNSARSKTTARYLGEVVGDLYVIVFMPGDATGDESSFTVDDLTFDTALSRQPKFVPRKKTSEDPTKSTHAEVIMPLASNYHTAPSLAPSYFAGVYDLLGLQDKKVQKIGQIGSFGNRGRGSFHRGPINATYTVGYRQIEDGPPQRFGDPHAIYNSSNRLLVCAFLAITEAVNNEHPDVLDSLLPNEPYWVA